MARSDRLFDILTLLRDGQLHTAQALAARFDVSQRTLYRDMDTLAAAGVPVTGTRGTGYRLALPVRPHVPSPTDPVPAQLPEAARRRVAPAHLALAVAAVALVVAAWAAWPRASERDAEPSIATESPTLTPNGRRAIRLDSTSEYYHPELSPLGVYHDTTTGRYFRFDTTIAAP